MIQYIADKEHYTKVLTLCEKVKHNLWIGTADLKDLYVEGGGRSGCGAVPLDSRQVVETGCRCAAASCQRARREFPRGFRQVSGLVEQVGTETLSAGAFQDNDFRLRHRLHRLRQPYRCRHWHEGRWKPQFRGENPHRRTVAGRCRSRTPRLRLARNPLCQMQAERFLRGQDWIKTFYKTDKT